MNKELNTSSYKRLQKMFNQSELSEKASTNLDKILDEKKKFRISKLLNPFQILWDNLKSGFYKIDRLIFRQNKISNQFQKRTNIRYN
jgi:hypothetical protein